MICIVFLVLTLPSVYGQTNKSCVEDLLVTFTAKNWEKKVDPTYNPIVNHNVVVQTPGYAIFNDSSYFEITRKQKIHNVTAMVVYFNFRLQESLPSGQSVTLFSMKPSDGATPTGKNVEMVIKQTGSTLSATIKKGDGIHCEAAVYNIANNGREEIKATAWFNRDAIFIRVKKADGEKNNGTGCGTEADISYPIKIGGFSGRVKYLLIDYYKKCEN